jgi:hypothetical protein
MSFSGITRHILGTQTGENLWYVLQLDPEASEVTVNTFKRFADAREMVSRLEPTTEDAPSQVVQVSASSVNELQEAYPNYFADTRHFLSVLDSFLREPKTHPQIDERGPQRSYM